MGVRVLVVFALLLLGHGAVHAQQSLSDKQRELQQLRNTILTTQKKLDQLLKTERKTKSSISANSRQRHRITSFIVTLRAELAKLQDSATALRGGIDQTSLALGQAEHQYNVAVDQMLRFKAEHRYDLHTSPTIDALFRSITQSVYAYRQEMTELKDSLLRQKQVLDDYSTTQAQVLSVQTQQERTLASNIKRSSRELKQIRKDRNAVKKELEGKQRSASRLRSIIAEQVATARKRAEQEAKRKARKKQPKSSPTQDTDETHGFAPRSLPWPTTSRTVLHGYGNYENSQTGITFDNPGIDIAAALGSSVRAVAEGTVSSITWLPGFGSLVIIDHGNSVRTVYANLAGVSVSKGASVRAGTPIGTTGENMDGALLHFEVWHGKVRQNPRNYLK